MSLYVNDINLTEKRGIAAMEFRVWSLVILLLLPVSGYSARDVDSNADESAQYGKYSAKIFSDYQKGALTFGKPGSDSSETLTVYPPARPALGVAIEWRKVLSVSWSTSVPGLNGVASRLHDSSIFHFEVHHNESPVSLDVHVLRYKGLYAIMQPKNDIRPFQDSLFTGDSGAAVLPDMILESASIGGIYNFDREALDLGALMNQSRVPQKTGWARLLAAQVRTTRFQNNSSIWQDVSDFKGGSLSGAIIGPGIAGQWVEHPWYAGGAGIFALAVTHSRLGEEHQKEHFAAFYNLRGSAGYNFGKNAWGIDLYKSILTVDRASISVTETVSKAQVFYAMRF
jgi:hypothetical protein